MSDNVSIERLNRKLFVVDFDHCEHFFCSVKTRLELMWAKLWKIGVQSGANFDAKKEKRK